MALLSYATLPVGDTVGSLGHRTIGTAILQKMGVRRPDNRRSDSTRDLSASVEIVYYLSL